MAAAIVNVTVLIQFATLQSLAELRSRNRNSVPVHDTNRKAEGLIHEGVRKIHQGPFDRTNRHHFGKTSHDREYDQAGKHICNERPYWSAQSDYFPRSLVDADSYSTRESDTCQTVRCNFDFAFEGTYIPVI